VTPPTTSHRRTPSHPINHPGGQAGSPPEWRLQIGDWRSAICILQSSFCTRSALSLPAPFVSRAYPRSSFHSDSRMDA
jgi:hypothetical protein